MNILITYLYYYFLFLSYFQFYSRFSNIIDVIIFSSLYSWSFIMFYFDFDNSSEDFIYIFSGSNAIMAVSMFWIQFQCLAFWTNVWLLWIAFRDSHERQKTKLFMTIMTIPVWSKIQNRSSIFDVINTSIHSTQCIEFYITLNSMWRMYRSNRC